MPDRPRPSPPLPPPATIMDVAARDFRFRHPAQVAAGRVVFRVRNEGDVEHQLVLIRVPEQVKGSLIEQLRSPERITVSTVALLGPIPPGRDGTFAVDATPGRYGLICFLRDRDGVQHALRGMATELLVSPLVAGASEGGRPGA